MTIPPCKNLLEQVDHKISLNENGEFEISINIFKGMSGLLESNRLNIPLLGKIPLDSKISTSSDLGTPYVISYPDSAITSNFNEIISKLIKNL